ncbi:hypothetical protein NECAME_05436 [Necator americanus]|uniref:Uncharacterized protein n=1 Tax=Necator americanus TaxID=51031 RepID=W2SJD5_NECAM|nr:hypothetical protein NECAME_05436 [Necator americanus]ETN68847.1 hypothetical protein NECAME_05436 [Necator americanus]
MFEQLRKVKREKSFVEQLREIVASSTITESSAKQLQFIPSTPIAKRPIPITIECREIDVQTSIRIGELPAITKEMRDTATDVPSLDYLSMSELGGLRQLPDNFIIQEDISSSAISSDQSAGQVPGNASASPRTPRISESPWRPSSRRLHLEEVDISTSHESNSIEVVSVASAHTPAAQPGTKSSQLRKVQEMVVHGAVKDPLLL